MDVREAWQGSIMIQSCIDKKLFHYLCWKPQPSLKSNFGHNLQSMKNPKCDISELFVELEINSTATVMKWRKFSVDGDMVAWLVSRYRPTACISLISHLRHIRAPCQTLSRDNNISSKWNKAWAIVFFPSDVIIPICP